MAVTVIGQPTPAVNTPSGTTTSLAAFTPNAGSEYEITGNVGFASNPALAIAFTSGGTGATPFVVLGSNNQFSQGATKWLVAFPPGVSPGSTVVKVTCSSTATDLSVTILELNGADPYQTAGAGAVNNSFALSLTPNFSGSLMTAALSNDSANFALSDATYTTLSTTTGSGTTVWAGYFTNPTVGGTAVTAPVFSPTSDVSLMVEIVPLGVTPTEDPNSPASTFSTSGMAAAQTYTPPFAAMTVAVMLEPRTANNSTAPALTVSDGTNTYTLVGHASTTSTGNGGGAFVYAHDYATAPGALTITATATAGSVTGCTMTVKGLLNTSAATGIGTVATKSNGTAAALDITGTPTKAFSRGYGCATRNGSTTAPAATNVTSLVAQAVTGTPSYSCNAFRSTAMTTVASTTYGYTTSSVGQVVWVEFEAVAAGGGSAATASASLTISGSAGASVTSTASASLTIGGSAATKAPSSAAASLSLAGTATGRATATASASLSITGSSSATVPTSASGALSITGSTTAASAASAAAALTLAGASTAAVQASATAVLTLAGSATTSTTATSAGALSLAGSGNAKTPVTAQAAMTLSGSATANAPATATAALTVTGSASAVASATATAALSINGNVSNGLPASGSGSLSITGTGGASGAASALGQLGISGQGAALAKASAQGALVLSGAGISTVPVSAAALLGLSGQAGTDGLAAALGQLSISGTAAAGAAGPLRDLSLIVAALPDRWAVDDLTTRWAVDRIRGRWDVDEVAGRWSATNTPTRWAVTQTVEA